MEVPVQAADSQRVDGLSGCKNASGGHRLSAGTQRLESKSAAFDPAMLEDHYRNALVRILRKKQAKMPAPPAPVAPSRENVINLMDALRRSIAAEPPAKKPAAASKAARAKRRSPVRHR